MRAILVLGAVLLVAGIIAVTAGFGCIFMARKKA